MSPKPPMYDDLNSDEELLWDALGENLEFSLNGKLISVSSLSLELRVLTAIMFHNLYPLSSTRILKLKGIHPSGDESPYSKRSPINIHTLNASIGHSRKGIKTESPASHGGSRSTPQVGSCSSSQSYDEKLDHIMASTVIRSMLALVTVERESRQRVQLLMVVHV
ncbi:hypothetical protein SO802_024754 [Lithocarpus litseifolius]|uniref:Uncharacterized protein n=1 Tax=Lithocarpus litseifolius TaxID=425828 RepID=A0AAW2CBA5_9ROSI